MTLMSFAKSHSHWSMKATQSQRRQPVMMPGLDGYDLVDQLRRDEKLCDLPVIMVTARTADEDISKGFSSGTDIYIEKPFKPSELVAFVRRFVGPAKPDAHP